MFFWNCMKIVLLAFFHTFDVENCKISIFGVGKCKISIFGLWRSTRVVFQLHLSVTLPFQAFLLVLIGFLYKTAQILLEKPFKNHRKKGAVFERFFKQDLSGLSGFSKKNHPNHPNRSNRSNLAGKPLKPPIYWAVFERDLDLGPTLCWQALSSKLQIEGKHRVVNFQGNSIENEQEKHGLITRALQYARWAFASYSLTPTLEFLE